MKRIIVALLILIISALAAVMYNFTFPNIGILKNIGGFENEVSS